MSLDIVVLLIIAFGSMSLGLAAGPRVKLPDELAGSFLFSVIPAITLSVAGCRAVPENTDLGFLLVHPWVAVIATAFGTSFLGVYLLRWKYLPRDDAGSGIARDSIA